MLKSDIVEKLLDRGALGVGAIQPDVPIAMGVRRRVAHDHLAKRPLPCLRSAAFLPDKAGDQQLFEVGGCHVHCNNRSSGPGTDVAASLMPSAGFQLKNVATNGRPVLAAKAQKSAFQVATLIVEVEGIASLALKADARAVHVGERSYGKVGGQTFGKP
ncbi:hypothetical protein [Novosphingobium aquimarinum]|uniref:hypothetical protein n=1 Tax=Novosphingobium aquimarinum TaxID=2682494 RepID=UPI0012EC6820|nr:hypothetical protein [Novosphingobium aquimarinum]